MKHGKEGKYKDRRTSVLIPGEKRELPQVTAGGSSSYVPLGVVKALNTIIKSNVILWLYCLMCNVKM